MNIKEFHTSDIRLASYLLVKNHEIQKIKTEGNKGTFYFNNIDNNIIIEFDTGRARVEPVNYNEQIKRLTTSVRRQASRQV